MLKKLLKYEFAALLRFWWIAAVTVLGVGVLGGVCIRVLENDTEMTTALSVLAIITLFLCFGALAVFAVLTFILVAMRYYNHFFTDQGYLTFTLPVKHTSLINAKLLSGVIMELLTVITIFISLVIAITVASYGYVEELEEPLASIPPEWLAFIPVYVVEGLALLLLASAFSLLFLYTCITFGCIITRKNKILATVGIYYALNSVFSFVVQLFYVVTFESLSTWATGAQIIRPQPLVALILFGLILFVALCVILLYALLHRMLERKLNLA